MARKPVAIEIVETENGRFVDRTYANGEVVREAVDLERKPTRLPRRPPHRLKSERMDKTRLKRF